MRHIHLAGIIPVAGLETDYEIDTPPILLPLEAGFTAIQKSVYECALAGCQTIWVVANSDLAPIVRKRIGEWVYDPVYYNRLRYGGNSDTRKEIPIYYVPISPKDRDRRDSYGWSILNGIYASWRTANHISKWIVPEKYFISFPMSAHNIHEIRNHRKEIADPSNNFFMEYEGETVLNNQPLSFTMRGQDYIDCRRDVNKKTTKEFYNTKEGEVYPSQKLPLKERWSARRFDLSEVFEKLSKVDAHIYECKWFYDLSTWGGYRDFLSSENYIKKPSESLTRPRKHGIIPYKA
jgi:hypothetical protein